MALNRECTAVPYIVGRMIAIVEHYAKDKFGPGTLANMFTHPSHGVSVFMRYVDKTDVYFNDIKKIQLPTTMSNEIEKSQIWVGYYHQKAAYDNAI